MQPLTLRQKTVKKQKERVSATEKAKMWNIFDSEVVSNNSQTKKLECIYRDCGNRENCDQCMSSLAFSDEGFLTCTNNKCGIIYKDIIDQGAEWRYYGADDNQGGDPTRCGMPINPLLKESSYGCKILCGGNTSYEMRKIRRYTEWQAMPYKEKSQYDEFQFISTMAHNAGLSKMIIDDAIRYHKKISEYYLTFRGDNRESILAGSIYVSCRINNMPRTPKEIATIFHLNATNATKGCKNVQQIINIIEKDLVKEEKTVFSKTTSSDFIERYCSKLNIGTELTKLCQFISIKIERVGLMPENTPHSIAAGIVFFVIQLCNLNSTKRDVKHVSDISEVTISKCHKKIEKHTNELVPGAILNKYVNKQPIMQSTM
jgi:transcription initiation factor TFIIB